MRKFLQKKTSNLSLPQCYPSLLINHKKLIQRHSQMCPITTRLRLASLFLDSNIFLDTIVSFALVHSRNSSQDTLPRADGVNEAESSPDTIETRNVEILKCTFLVKASNLPLKQCKS